MVGADVVVTLAQPAEVPPALAGRTTEVLRVNGVLVGGVQTDILVIDPATFARDAFWDDRPIGMSAVRRDGRRARRRRGRRLAAARAASQQITYLGRRSPADRASRAVDGAARQPGQLPDDADRPARRPATSLTAARRNCGCAATRRRSGAQSIDAGLPLARITVARDLYADTVFEAVTYTFDYLAALSLLTGLITAVGPAAVPGEPGAGAPPRLRACCAGCGCDPPRTATALAWS